TEGKIYGSPALYEGRVIVADDKGFVYAIGTEGGREEWKVELSDKRFWSSPTVVDGVVYIGGMDKRLYALDIETGAIVWVFKAGGAIASTPLVVGDLVYVGAFDRKFYAIDRATGEERGVFKVDHWVWNDAIHHNGVIYVGSLGGTFYALEVETLMEVWRFPPKGSPEPKKAIRSAAVIVDDRIFIATRSGNVQSLRLDTGNQDRRESFPIGAKVLASLAVADGVLYVSDQNERLHIREVRAQ
ncbi:MAG: PQQ-binding-like beta-propeller repeat protein, partial [Dehalococcoidia bacterium]